MMLRTRTEETSLLQAFRQLPGPVWTLLVGTFINKAGSFELIFLVPFLIRRGLSAPEAGLALGAYGIGAVAGVVLGGRLVDRIGGRLTVSLSMGLAGVLTVSLLTTRNALAILLIAAASGAAAQTYRPAASMLLVTLTPRKRHVIMFAIYRVAFNLGATVGPLVGALLVTRASFPILFWADASTSLFFGLAALTTLPREPVADRGAGPDGDPQPGVRAKLGYARVLADRRFSLFLLAIFLNAVVYIQYLVALPLHLARAGLPLGLFGVLVGLNGLTVIAFELPVNRFVQHWPASRAIPLGIALIGAGITLYGGPATLPWLALATIMWSIGESVESPTSSAYPAKVAAPELRGRYLAAGSAAESIGYAIGPIVGAWAWAHLGEGTWLTCALVALIAFVTARAGIVRAS